MKTGLILEGGSMRGMFTAGILDVFMENKIDFDGAIGVSAGAVFGCNYKSHQIGRALRYNKKYCRDKRYVSFSSLIFTGDIFNAKFDYDEIPNRLDPFDSAEFKASPIEFYVVATDVDTGRAIYRKCENGGEDDIQWMRASASMPGLSNVVYREVNGKTVGLSDGGTADSIPLKYFESIGYDRNVVILTQPDGFRKEENKFMPYLKLRLRKYPALLHALSVRHVMYNETIDYIKQREAEGSVLVIRPPEPLNIKPIVHDPNELERVYQIGRREGEKNLEKVKIWLDAAKVK
ncbi:MAG: patatin family protein [Eubacteriales bacterium]